MISKTNRLLGAILLVSGTTIGAGMLALPVTTGLAGFFPSMLVMVAIWLYMMLTAFYLLEVNLKVRGESNLISMMRLTLGRKTEIGAWIIYLLLLYSLTAAYMVGCSQILEDFLTKWIPFSVPGWIWPTLIFFIFGSFVYCGTEIVDFLNRFLMLGLVLAYIVIISLSCCKISLPLLGYTHWKYFLPSVSIVLTTFGYHIILPTLTTYLEHDEKLLKRAIFIGSLIPFLIYLVWQAQVMGVVPVHGEHSLFEAAQKGLQITFFLKIFLTNPLVGASIRAFAFFAIVTSLIGVSLSLSDFLADGMNIKKTKSGKFFLVILTFIPPLIFALFYPEGFIIALKFAGIFVAVLLALLPSVMAFFERRKANDAGFTSSKFQVFGGKALIIFSIIFSLFLIGVEVAFL